MKKKNTGVRVASASPEAIVDNALDEWGSPAALFPPELRAAYVDALRDPAHFARSSITLAP